MEHKTNPQSNYLLFNKADSLSRKIYKTTLNLPYKYQSSIGDQLRRASLSVILNIVEGGARQSIKERHRFNVISFGSLKETKYLIFFCHGLHLMEEKLFEEIAAEIDELARIMYGLLYKKGDTKA